MKKLIAWAFFALMSVPVFAQVPGGCLPAPQVQGQPQRCWDGRIVPAQNVITGSQTWNPYNGVVGQQYGQQIVQQGAPVQYVQPQYYNGGVPGGNGLSNCTLVGALAGGTLGSLAHHHTGQAVILGALAGGVAGNWLCNNSQGQRVVVLPQGQYQQQAGMPPQYGDVYGGAHPNHGVSCTVRSVADGSAIRKTIRVMSPADCEAISGFVEDAKQQVGKIERSGDVEVSPRQKDKLEETSYSSGSERSNCVLRIRGKIVAEKEVPESDKDDAKSFCGRWQRQEAQARGLL